MSLGVGMGVTSVLFSISRVPLERLGVQGNFIPENIWLIFLLNMIWGSVSSSVK